MAEGGNVIKMKVFIYNNSMDQPPAYSEKDNVINNAIEKNVDEVDGNTAPHEISFKTTHVDSHNGSCSVSVSDGVVEDGTSDSNTFNRKKYLLVSILVTVIIITVSCLIGLALQVIGVVNFMPQPNPETTPRTAPLAPQTTQTLDSVVPEQPTTDPETTPRTTPLAPQTTQTLDFVVPEQPTPDPETTPRTTPLAPQTTQTLGSVVQEQPTTVDSLECPADSVRIYEGKTPRRKVYNCHSLSESPVMVDGQIFTGGTIDLFLPYKKSMQMCNVECEEKRTHGKPTNSETVIRCHLFSDTIKYCVLQVESDENNALDNLIDEVQRCIGELHQGEYFRHRQSYDNDMEVEFRMKNLVLTNWREPVDAENPIIHGQQLDWTVWGRRLTVTFQQNEDTNRIDFENHFRGCINVDN